jgi:hypothetical protein
MERNTENTESTEVENTEVENTTVEIKMDDKKDFQDINLE